MKKIFISYSHKDVAFKDMLVEQLRVLELENLCDIWEDSRIEPGADWFPEIRKAIDEADIAILMISAGFLTSGFIRGNEIPPILERRKNEGLTVLPLFMKPCAWKKVPWLSCIQGFPCGKKSLMEMEQHEQLRELTGFAEYIYDLVHQGKNEITGIPSPGHVTHNGKAILFTPLPPRLTRLIGRNTELDQLEKIFDTAERVVLVNGLGGIGKTEVCKTFFYTHYNQYCYAGWVDWMGTVKESLVYALGGDKSKFIRAGEKDTEDQRFEKIMDRLGQMRETFLLVLDNIENPEDKDLATLTSLPQEIKILASSRCHIEGYEEMSLDFLSPGECKELFYRYYKGNRDDEGVEKVVALCGYHTLTVELLARTAYHSVMSIGTLYEALKSKGFNLNEVTGGKISTFWRNKKEKQTFFDHLVKVFEISGVTEGELAVLVNVSVLPSVYIKMESVREWLELGGMDELNALVEKGWFRRDEESRIYMHPVMQEVVRYRAKPGAENCRVLIGSLANKLLCKPGDNPLHKKEFLIFGEAVVRWMDAEENDEDLATLVNNLSQIYQAMGQLDWALGFQLKANRIYEAVLDNNDPLRAMSYNNSAQIYLSMVKLDLALEFQLKANQIYETVLDSNDPLRAMAYNNVAQIYLSMSQLDRALKFQLKALKIVKSVLDSNHPNLASAYNNVSQIYLSMAQPDRALEFQLKALKIRESVLDPNHPDRTQSYHNLSTIYRDMNDFPAALGYAEKAVAIMEKTFPEGHPNLDKFKKNRDLIKTLV